MLKDLLTSKNVLVLTNDIMFGPHLVINHK